MKDFFEIYDTIISSVKEEKIQGLYSGERWTLCESASGSGLAMTTEGESVAPMFPSGLEKLSTAEAAQAMKSWNLKEAGFGLAAANSVLNTAERLESLNCYEPFENYCTRGIDFHDKTVALIGHMNGPAYMRRDAKKVYILERDPKMGDYPDSACDFILPQCDVVLITGSSLVNKTLPHLLELCKNACTILTGPSVPMCPELLDLGFSRIAGLVPEKREDLRCHVVKSQNGTPYIFGRPFLFIK